MHQDHGSIWFWTDGQWTSLDLVAHTAAVEAAYAIIVAFDWAQYVVDLKSSDRRARDEAVQLATSLLHPPTADGDAVRSMNTQSYVRYVVSESDEHPLAASNLLDTTAHAQRVFDHGLPRLSVDRVSMASPGVVSFRGLAGPARQFRFLLRDAWGERVHEPGVSKGAIDVARQYVSDRSYALGMKVKALEARATRDLALVFELLHRQEVRGKLAEVRRSLDYDVPVPRDM